MLEYKNILILRGVVKKMLPQEVALMNTLMKILLAMLMTVFLGSVAYAEGLLGEQGPYGPSSIGHTSSSPMFFSGNVVSVDPEAGTLTVEPRNSDVTSSYLLQGEVTLSTDEMTSIKMCNNSASLSDILIGEKLDVTYHEKDGTFFADDIHIAKPC
jgi:hypothetical protein